MAGLKELRTRIEAIKSTKKITSAMKMVAASGLRRAQGLIGKCEIYNNNLKTSAMRVIYDLKNEETEKGITHIYPDILTGKGKNKNYLLVVISSDKGLCGGYNAYVAKAVISRINELQSQDKEVKIICVGKKARDIIKRKYAELIVDTIEGVARKGANYDEAVDIANPILAAYEKGEFDVVEIVSSVFISAITREIEARQFLPMPILENATKDSPENLNKVGNAFYDYEPDKMEMLEGLSIMIVKAVIFNAIVQAQASEQGARMASMDNATRNASDVVSRLTLRYNGIRQSAITTELTEIISGAEAL